MKRRKFQPISSQGKAKNPLKLVCDLNLNSCCRLLATIIGSFVFIQIVTSSNGKSHAHAYPSDSLSGPDSSQPQFQQTMSNQATSHQLNPMFGHRQPELEAALMEAGGGGPISDAPSSDDLALQQQQLAAMGRKQKAIRLEASDENSDQAAGQENQRHQIDEHGSQQPHYPHRLISLHEAGGGDEPRGQAIPMASSAASGASQDVESQHLPTDESIESSHEMPADSRSLFIDHQRHNSQLQAMHDLFERRQLSNQQHFANQQQLPASQELSPISINLADGNGANGAGFNLPSFHDSAAGLMGGPAGKLASMVNPLASADNMDGPGLPFGLQGPSLPHLLGFQAPPAASGPPFVGPLDSGPQRGDQMGHSMAASTGSGGDVIEGPIQSQKVWPKIFRFTDGRINLSDFEKQKKIRLSSKNQHSGENHIESAPIMFDGRQLKRKSFLILHGGIFS